MGKLGIIGAMETEVQNIRQKMTESIMTEHASLCFYEGKLCGLDVVIVRSGIGKVNAAICAQQMIDLFHVEAIVNTGIAGSLCADLNIGDIVLSTDTLQHDMDAVAFGYEAGVIPQMEISTFPADGELRSLSKELCSLVNPDINVFEGRILSGDQFIAAGEKKNWLRKTFKGLCTEMEGAAIAHTAFLNGVPFLIIRAISDKADDSAKEDYSSFEAKAILHSERLMLALCERLSGLH